LWPGHSFPATVCPLARLDGFPAGHFLFIAVAVAPTLPPASRKRKGRWTVTEPSNAPATHRQQAAREL